MYKSQTLDTIRQNIDRIDNTVHDMLCERASLASSIAAEKKKRGMPVVHPAREARMVRRLLSRHQGPLPKEAVARIWRELVGAVSMLQSGLTAHFYTDKMSFDDFKTVTDYFGSILPVKYVDNAQAVLDAVANGKADFATLPNMISSDGVNWLPDLISVIRKDRNDDIERPLSVVQSHPFIKQADEEGKRYLTFTRALFEPSDDDCSLIVVYMNAAEDVDIESVVTKSGLNILSHKEYIDGNYYAVIEVDDYVEVKSPVLEKLADNLPKGAEVYAIGGYPKPISV